MCEEKDEKMQFFKLMLTGKDNETYEIARVLLFIGFISLVAFAGYDLWLAHPFDPMNYSMGMAGLLFGGSGGIAVKARTEPEKEERKDGND